MRTRARRADSATNLRASELRIGVRVEFSCDDAFGIEREHAIEKYPDDLYPVFGFETEALFGGASRAKYRAQEIVDQVTSRSLRQLLRAEDD